MKLADNTILITGGSSGIGLALAKSLYELGNKIIIAARDGTKLDRIKVRFPGIEVFECDLTKQSQIDSLIVFIEQQHPDLNILFNNAAIQYNYHFLSEQNMVNKVDYEVGANLVATIKLCGLLVPTLVKNRNAAIVNVSSGLAISPKQSAPVYCATKAAIHSFTKAFRYQMQGTPLKVFEILPPLVATPMTEGRGRNKLAPEQVVEEFLNGFKKDKPEIYIGKSRMLKLIHRISPRIADRIMRNN